MKLMRRECAKRNVRLPLIAGLAVCISAGLGSAQQKPDMLTHKEAAEGFQPLSNGMNLDGWKPLATSSASDNGDWSVSDGDIVCPGTTAGWLASNGTYTNFELRLQFKAAETTNSGVFLRSSTEGQPHITGYELQIWDYQPGGYDTGSLVGAVKAKTARIRDHQWNTYDITADGDHFVAILNGRKILDGHNSKHIAGGHIGFQCNKENKIEFRDLRIRSLQQ
jgi:hypothetical protein